MCVCVCGVDKHTATCYAAPTSTVWIICSEIQLNMLFANYFNMKTQNSINYKEIFIITVISRLRSYRLSELFCFRFLFMKKCLEQWVPPFDTKLTTTSTTCQLSDSMGYPYCKCGW